MGNWVIEMRYLKDGDYKRISLVCYDKDLDIQVWRCKKCGWVTKSTGKKDVKR